MRFRGDVLPQLLERGRFVPVRNILPPFFRVIKEESWDGLAEKFLGNSAVVFQ
jgi:hypothetical protein